MTALMFRSAHRSRIAIASFFCCSVGSAGLLGQSMLPTVATQTPRNSRGASGGSSGTFVAIDVDGEVVLVRGVTQLPTNSINRDRNRVARMIFPSAPIDFMRGSL